VPFLGIKPLEHVFGHPAPNNAEVIERVEVYPYYTSGPLWLVYGVNFTFISTQCLGHKNQFVDDV
jgi:hypothetical protein